MEDDYFENMNTEYEFDCFNDEEYYNLKKQKCLYLDWKKGSTLTYKELEYLYYELSNYPRKFKENSKLEINLHSETHTKVCEQLCKFRLPNLRVVGLLSVEIQPEIAVQFLKTSVPEQVESFFISGDTFSHPLLSEYLPLIITNSKRVKSELWIRLFTVTQSDIESILNAFPQVSTLGFYDCSFTSISSDLCLDQNNEYNIEKLSFEETCIYFEFSFKINL